MSVTAESRRTAYHEQQSETSGFVRRSALSDDSWFHHGSLSALYHIKYNHLGSLSGLAPGPAQSIPLLTWPGRALFLHWVRPPRSLEPPRWHFWQPQLPREHGESVDWLRWGWQTALMCFLRHEPEQYQIPLYPTKSGVMSKAAACSGTVESVYYRFLKTRCERQYKHTWHWNLHTGGISLPQGYLCLCCFILASSTWLKTTSGNNWLFPSPLEAWPWKPKLLHSCCPVSTSARQAAHSYLF